MTDSRSAHHRLDACRVAAMLTGLLRSEQARADPSAWACLPWIRVVGGARRYVSLALGPGPGFLHKL